MTRIDDVADLLGKPNCGCVPGETAACALDAAGHLAPDLPEPTGYNAGLPWWGACDTEVRPAGYEQRVICIDENGPWEATAQDVREFAYALLAAADYAEETP